jgi:hypothetical protein
MKSLTTRQKIRAIRALLSGSSVLEASKQLGISSGSISNIFTEFREGSFAPAGDVIEQVDQLRETAILLKKSNLSPGQCLVGLVIFSEIVDCGLDPSDIRRLSTVMKLVSTEENAQKLIGTVRRIADVENRLGIPIQELEEKVNELEEKAVGLQSLVDQREKCEHEITEMTRRQEELVTSVNHLNDKHKLLTRHINNLEKREESLTVRVRTLQSKVDNAEKILADANAAKQELASTGLSIGDLIEFDRRVKTIAQHHNIFPSFLKTKLFNELEKLEQGLGIEKLIRVNQTKLNEQTKRITEGQEEHTRLIAAVGVLKKEKVKLESSITEIKQNIADEISKLAPAATNAINAVLKELNRGRTEVFNQLKEQESEHARVVATLQKEETIMILHLEKTSHAVANAIDQTRTKALEEVGNATRKMALDIKTWGDAKAEINTHLGDLKFAQYLTSIPLTKEVMDRLVENINPVVIIQYLAIIATFCSKNLNIKMSPPKWIIRKYYQITEYTDVESVDLIKWAIEYFI